MARLTIDSARATTAKIKVNFFIDFMKRKWYNINDPKRGRGLSPLT